jgi:hypothetical protein
MDGRTFAAVQNNRVSGKNLTGLNVVLHIKADESKPRALIDFKRRISGIGVIDHSPKLLFPNRACGESCENNASPCPEGSNHGPKPDLLRQWIVGLLGLNAPIACVAVYQIDKRRPHPSWITILPLILFAIMAIACCFQLHVLAKVKDRPHRSRTATRRSGSTPNAKRAPLPARGAAPLSSFLWSGFSARESNLRFAAAAM